MKKKIKFSNKEKIQAKEAMEKIDEICIEKIGEEYRVKMDHDSGGSLINVLFEGKCPPLAIELIRGPFFGWHLVKTIVPEGYLDVFYPLSNSDESEM